MRAVVQDRYGPPGEVLSVRQVPVPVPGPGEVRVQVRGASVHPDIWHAVTGLPYVLRLMGGGVWRPRQPVPGIDLAGVVDAVGPDVRGLRPGDEVFGEIVPLHQWRNGGAFAELAIAREEDLALKPPSLTFAEAAALPTSGLIALRSLRQEGQLRAGTNVLVNGAAGGVGALAVQIAKAAGARVTAVDRTDKLAFLTDLGADEVVDCAEDWARREARYHLVLDVASTLSYPACRPLLTDDGRYVVIGHDHFDMHRRRWLGSLPTMFALVARSAVDGRLPPPASLPPRPAELEALRELAERGAVRPRVDRTYGLDAVPEALFHLQRGGVCGKLVIVPSTVAHLHSHS